MNILLDLNIIIDLLVQERKGHSLANEINNIIEQRGYIKWISASSMDNLEYVLLSEAKRFNLKYKDKIRLECRKMLENMKIFSVTGTSIRKAIKEKDIEDSIIYMNFKRIAPDGIIISNDEDFKTYPDVVSPEEFLGKYSTSYISPLTSHTIPMLDLQEEYRYMLEDIDEAVLKNIADTKYILGPEVKMLEDKVAEYIGVKQCIGVSSGTDALVLSLRALAIKLKGQEYFDKTDEIITTPFTFTATGDAILRAGATPVFVDIDPNTFNIDPTKIREYLTERVIARDEVPKQSQNSKVVGIIPVHLYGQSCQMDEIMDIAKDFNIFILEDVAQAFGGVWKGKKLGSMGTTGCFSFFPSKNLGGFGDGGMVSTNDDEIAELVRMLLKHGGKDKYNVDHIGYNARLDTLQAAILLAKFKYIDEFNERRRKIADYYNRGLAEIDGLSLPITHHLSPTTNNNPSVTQSLNSSISLCHVYHQYTVRVQNIMRDTMMEYLRNEKINSVVYYPFPLHKMKVFKNGNSKIFGSLEKSEKAAQEVLSLPIEPLQSLQDTDNVVTCITRYFSSSHLCICLVYLHIIMILQLVF